jgi:hypothetical protein
MVELTEQIPLFKLFFLLAVVAVQEIQAPLMVEMLGDPAVQVAGVVMMALRAVQETRLLSRQVKVITAV